MLTYLVNLPMLLLGQVPQMSNQNHLFWDLEDAVLIQTLSYNTRWEKNNVAPITDWLFS